MSWPRELLEEGGASGRNANIGDVDCKLQTWRSPAQVLIVINLLLYNWVCFTCGNTYAAVKNEFGGGFDVNHVHRIATSGVVQYPINLERVHLNCKAKISGGQRQEDAKLLTLTTCMLSKLYKVLWGDFYILLLQKLSSFLAAQDSSMGDVVTR